MKLFFAPGTCALGIRILLEMTGAEFETETISLAKGEQRRPEYLAQNPKGKVPALVRPDGSILTEYPVISLWIAHNFPAAKLLPEDADGEYRALELVEYVVATLHMRGATLAMRPDKFVADEAAREALRSHGRDVLREGFELLSARLGDRDWFFDNPGIVDAAVFYLLSWRERIGVEIPAVLDAFYKRMEALPAVARARNS